MDDRELMLKAAGGSRAAFGELVHRYERRLIAYFQNQCADRDLAEDCTQEVFVRLYKARGRYGPEARFSTFLFTIARNYWIDVMRSRRSRPESSSLNQGEEGSDRAQRIPSPDPSPFDQAEVGEEVQRLREAVAALPEGQRDVVLLGVIEGLPYAEVSQILGIPIGTVKSRVHTAVHALRELFADPSPQNAARAEREASRKRA